MNTQPKKPQLQGKTASHRDAVIKSQLLELIRNERLQTTSKKAKLLKQQFDILVNEAKKANIASRRNVESKLGNSLAVTKLYSKLLPKLSDSVSGYTVSARTLPRKGDRADQMIVMVKGTEIRERKSRLASALERRDVAAEEDQGVGGRIRKAVSSATKLSDASKRGGSKRESQKDTRRLSK